MESLGSLWDGHALDIPEIKARWEETVQQWTGAVAVGGTGCLYVYPKLATVQALQVTLPEVS